MKRLTQTLAFCLLTVFTAVAQKNYVSEVWVSDLGNGKYKNPVLYADYSDPDACRVGDDFYMTSSSFNCLPGLQILHSKDLVNWTIIGAAVPNALPPIETPERPEHGNRVWAPAIRHHNGEFYIFWGDPDQGAFMTIIISSIRQVVYRQAGRSYYVLKTSTVLTNGKQYSRKVTLRSTVLIRVHGWILLPEKTGSSTFRMSALTDVSCISNR